MVQTVGYLLPKILLFNIILVLLALRQQAPTLGNLSLKADGAMLRLPDL